MVQALQLGSAHGPVRWLCLKLGQSLAEVILAGSIVVAGNDVEWPCGRVEHPEKVMVLVCVLS